MNITFFCLLFVKHTVVFITEGVIGKLSSKLRKSENNTDILIYEIH